MSPPAGKFDRLACGAFWALLVGPLAGWSSVTPLVRCGYPHHAAKAAALCVGTVAGLIAFLCVPWRPWPTLARAALFMRPRTIARCLGPLMIVAGLAGAVTGYLKWHHWHDQSIKRVGAFIRWEGAHSWTRTDRHPRGFRNWEENHFIVYSRLPQKRLWDASLYEMSRWRARLYYSATLAIVGVIPTWWGFRRASVTPPRFPPSGQMGVFLCQH